MTATFHCEACHQDFARESKPEDVVAETEAAFGEIPVEEQATVCHDCWLAMRAKLPELDAIYREVGL